MGAIVVLMLVATFGAYVALSRKLVSIVSLKTHSVLATLATVAFIILAPTWDTVVNRLYHKFSLCKRDDVGLNITEKIKLPSEYYDHNGRFLEPEGWFTGRTLVANRYQRKSGYEQGGVFPATAYEKRFSGVFDTNTQKFVSYKADFWTKGGGWWPFIFQPFFSQEDYSRYVRGLVAGANCEIERGDTGTVNDVFRTN